MSLISVSNPSADAFAVSRQSRCSASSVVSSVSATMPRMPFIGVRISWLMFARNALLARLAACAASSAWLALHHLFFQLLIHGPQGLALQMRLQSKVNHDAKEDRARESSQQRQVG